jgi:tRNA-specific 2-thiouridylase
MTPQPSQTTIMVAMSGGVDSSVTAALLQQRGYTVVGVFMLLAQADGLIQAERARRIADSLGICLEVVDLAAEFKRQVLDYFSGAYQAGKTPNPCVVCNRTIKFGLLREFGRSLGITAMATGHYARTAVGPDGRVRLLTGLDPKKDQSYFLAALGQQQLAGLSFPLGETTKEEVYRAAAELGLSGLHSAESQDICFLHGRNLSDFFAGLPLRPGDFVTRSGEVRGRHQGIHLYTVGQRRGLGIPDATPYYVVGLDPVGNQVVIGKEEDLWQDRLTLAEMRWTAGVAPELPQSFMVKIRYRHAAAPALVSQESDGSYSIKFTAPQRAITPGQFAVLYQDDEVIGSGAIAVPVP